MGPKRGAGHPHHLLDPHEVAEAAHAAEALGWTPDSAAEREEEKLESDDEHAKKEQQEQQLKVQLTSKAATPAQESQHAQQQLQKAQRQPVGSDAFQTKSPPEAEQQAKARPVTHFAEIARLGPSEVVTAAKTTEAVREAAERAIKAGKPPDAFTLLNASQPHGVFFKENFEREGHAEAQEDPELRAAVDECIRLLFGVRGITRVGPGRNEADEPVIIVVAGPGFGEGSLREVPATVHRYSTLVVLPFEVLPLKKER
ncbi:MAG: hypothetical protein IPJ65_17285 [Archangiaceae bacterium]|nr:hypothetical protein [Archangiaceae bacterium]